MIITPGRIVLYTLSKDDATQINRRRTHPSAIGHMSRTGLWPAGAQAHIGDYSYEGETYPLLVTKVDGDAQVNGQVFLDGNDVLWVTRRKEGTTPGFWFWPPKV